MKPAQLDACLCPARPNEHPSGARRVAGIVVAIMLLAVIVWGETWAIEHVPIEVAQWHPTVSTELARVISDVSSDSGAPIAIVH